MVRPVTRTRCAWQELASHVSTEPRASLRIRVGKERCRARVSRLLVRLASAGPPGAPAVTARSATRRALASPAPRARRASLRILAARPRSNVPRGLRCARTAGTLQTVRPVARTRCARKELASHVPKGPRASLRSRAGRERCRARAGRLFVRLARIGPPGASAVTAKSATDRGLASPAPRARRASPRIPAARPRSNVPRELRCARCAGTSRMDRHAATRTSAARATAWPARKG